jgi:hypothetical protein
MSKFRKKQLMVEAFQWWSDMGSCGGVDHQESSDDFGVIRTLEGVMTVSAGDWVITGVKGEIYPCKPDIFEATYEFIED